MAHEAVLTLLTAVIACARNLQLKRQNDILLDALIRRLDRLEEKLNTHTIDGINEEYLNKIKRFLEKYNYDSWCRALKNFINPGKYRKRIEFINEDINLILSDD